MSKKKILLIEDTPATIDVIRKILSDAHYDVFISTNGELGISKAEINFPDLILLDILMPGIDGFETCKRLKSSESTKNIPVVFMSALADSFDKVKAFQLGAADYVTKPINHEELLARVNTHIELNSLQKKLTEENIGLEEKVKQQTNQLRLTNEALRLSEKKYRTIIDSTTDIIFTVDRKGKLLFINEQVYTQLGHVPSEGIGKSFLEFVPKSEIPRYLLKLKEIFFKKELKNFETVVYDINRNKVPVEINGRIIKQDNKTVALGSFRLIAERKKAEQSLKDSELRFKTQFNNLPIPTYIWKKENDDFVFIDFNNTAASLTRGNMKDFLGNRLSEIFKDKPEIIEDINDCYKRKELIRKETLYHLEVGPPKYLDVAYSFVPPDLVMVHTDDITDRIQSEIALYESEKKYRTIIESTTDIIFTVDKAGKLLFINEQAFHQLGYVPRERIGKPSFKFVPKSEIPRYSLKLKEFFLKKELKNFETVVYDVNKNEVPVEINGRVIEQDNKTVALGSLKLIAERKKAEQALKDSELRFKTLSNLTFEGILILSNGIAIDFNSSFEKMFGYKRKELLDKNVVEMLILKEYHKLVYGYMAEMQVSPYEAKGIKKDGTIFPIEIEAKVITDQNNSQKKVVAVRDITIRKEAERAMIESSDRYRMIVESISDGLAVIDFNGKLRSANPSACSMYGYSIEEILKLSLSDIIHPDYSSLLKKIMLSLESDKPLEQEIVTVHKNGTFIYVNIKAMLFNFNRKKGLLLILSNISAQKKRELEILESITQTEEKERSRFAQELHDGIGPLLSATKIYSKALQFAEDEQEKAYTLNKLNQTINEAIISTQEISNNISPHILRNFGLKKAIESFYKKISLKNSMDFDFHSNVEKRLDEKIETTLYRVVVELINNTIKHANASLIVIIIILHDNKISLNYSDNGTGFDVDDTMSKGGGMGLFNIYSRIRSLNGNIAMSSKKNKGFEVDIQINIEQLIPKIAET